MSMNIRRHKRLFTILLVIALGFALATFLRLIAFSAFKLSGKPTWEEVVKPGAWSAENSSATTMAVYSLFGVKLYIGTRNDALGCQVWGFDGRMWSVVSESGIGNSRNKEVTAMAVFNSALFAGTRNSEGCEVRRYEGTIGWTLVTKLGFGVGEDNVAVSSMAVLGNNLYVGTRSTTGGFDLYRSPDGTTWETVTRDGFGHPDYSTAASMTVFDDGSGPRLYIGTTAAGGCGVLSYGGAGAVATVEGKDGLGDRGNDTALSCAVYKSKLYIGTRNSSGCQVRRFEDKGRWTLVGKQGFGNAEGNKEVSSLFTAGSHLHAGTGPGTNTGPAESCQLFRTGGGNAPYEWSSENVNGFADDHNRSIRSCAVYNNQLYVGTSNPKEGCGIYRFSELR